jgi:transitional endoplasmic reticulum ATPase
MSDASSNRLNALFAALRASPANSALLDVVLGECADTGEFRKADEALEIARIEPDALASNVRRAIAVAALKANDLDSVLRWADAAEPEGQLLLARAHLAKGDRDKATSCYREAIAGNAALEDPRLTSELSGKIVSLALARNSAPLRSIANDDTKAADVLRILQPEADRTTFADVGGLDEVKQQIRRRIITPFLKPSLFERFKRRAGGGILMYGPPGCGKTLLARGTAGECGAKFFNVAITDVLDMYIGESERKLHELFEQARRGAPAVVFFDEIEALGGKRQFTREATSAKLVSQFLTELDGFSQNNHGVLILAATNVPWAVDPAFRRPGRFDRVLFVPPPDQTARKIILDLLLHERPVASDIDTSRLAALTSGFSGADLRNLVETAVDEAIEQSIADATERALSMAHLRAALAETRQTTLEWLTTARNHARYANQGGQYDEVLQFLDKHGTR